MSNIKVYIFSLAIAVGFFGCRGTSKLPEGEYLYTGGELQINSEAKITDKSDLTGQIEGHIKPEPNAVILGMRPKLWFYNIFDTVKKEKGFKHWVKYKLGEAPVLLKHVDQERVSMAIQRALEDNGFFYPEVTYSNDTSKKTASVKYIATVDTAYTYKAIHLPEDDNALARAIKTDFVANTTIKAGERYNLQKLHDERIRIEEALKNKGFYYFADSYLLYEIDTTVGHKQVEVFMTIKSETPPQAKRIQQINEVVVNTDFELTDSVFTDYDTIQVEGLSYIRKTEKFKPKVITNQIRLRENDIYTREAEEVTISRLIDLGVFKYVNIHFEDAGPGKINSFMRLSPMKKKSIQVELQGVTKSNSFVGPAFQASFSNRNFLKGAELYRLTLTAGYEWQIGPKTAQQSPNSYELGIMNTLAVPKFITPFNIDNRSSRYVPQTNFKLGFRMLKRIDFFQLNSFDLGYGFTWRETVTKTHQLFPVDIAYIRLSNTSDYFQALLDSIPYMRRSYENQFILGSNYNFIYNSQSRPENVNRTNNFFFKANFDISGNIMHLLQKSRRSEESTEDDPYTIFGSQYSQFVRTDFDFRHYFRFDRKNKLATRFIFGLGKAFGNSEVLPYTKQFSIGGSSSIRAFRARALGPGRFSASDTVLFVDQAADIKLETNIEYRFDLVGALKGAVFVDAGNIWSIAEDPRQGQFKPDSFIGEIAVGAGVGVRLDIQFFVLRLDLATPLKVPSKDPGDRWGFALREVNSQGERVSTLVWNIAIGYPF